MSHDSNLADNTEPFEPTRVSAPRTDDIRPGSVYKERTNSLSTATLRPPTRVWALLNRPAVTLALFVAAFLTPFVAGLSDYGINYDAALGEIHLGDRYFNFLTSWNWDYLDLTKDNIELYQHPDHPNFFQHSSHAITLAHHFWGLSQTLTAASKYLLFAKLHLLDPIDAHHFAIGVAVAVQIVAMFIFLRQEFNVIVALFALCSLVIHPRYWAHLHNNPKDIMESVLYTLVIFSFYRGLLLHQARWVLLSALLWGLALATKANALFLAPILAPFTIVALTERLLRRQPVINLRLFGSFLAFPVIGLGTLMIAWPLLLANFPATLLNHVDFLLDRGLEGPSYWQSMPLRKLLYTTPPLFLGLALLGMTSSLARLARRKTFRSIYILLFLWLAIPIVRVSMPRAQDFDMIRHWIEFLPPFAIFAGLGLQGAIQTVLALVRQLRLWQHVEQQPFLVLLGCCALHLPTISWNINNHPFQIVYFNNFIGGLKGAKEAGIPEASDYWGSSYRIGQRWLTNNAPPNSILYVGFAEHIVEFSHELWLRPDIELRKFAELSSVVLDHQTPSTPTFLMYATREGHYSEMLRQLDQTLKPVFEVVVDGGAVLRILRLDQVRGEMR